jgi:hypothetical protein
MKKLALHLDDLRVETFEPLPPESVRHTVLGHQGKTPESCNDTCPNYDTCGGFTCPQPDCTNDSCDSCVHTCKPTCGATCLSGDPRCCPER